MRTSRLLTGVVSAALLSALVATPTAAAPARPVAVELPSTPVAAQLRWLTEASRRLPISDAELRAHLTPELLAAVPPAQFNRTLAEAGGLRVTTYRPQPRRDTTQAYARLAAARRPQHAVLVVDDAGRIAALQLTAVPRSWSEVETQVRALAPRASFVAAEITPTGRCRTRFGLDERTSRPIGSAFKLYVLGALADAVRAGRASWNEQLAVRPEWKADTSSPIGATADGTRLTLRRYAEDMIFFSDNSATDHLIGRLGRSAVEAQVDSGANRPFLTTREASQLKTVRYPELADRYAAATTNQRRALLDELATLPRPDLTGWTGPRHIDTVEWFASPVDVCRTFAGLTAQNHADATIGAVLAQQGTAAPALDPRTWPVGWSKGGSEPGVVTQNFAATHRDGRTFVVSVMLSNPAAPMNSATTSAAILATVAGAYDLLAAP